MTPEFLIGQFGYVGLFIISVLAASILPLSSEVFVVAMPILGYNIWVVGLVATAGNYVGALTNYYIGLKGSNLILGRFFKLDERQVARAEQWFGRWGAPALLMSWAPIVGDPLCAVAGMLHMGFWKFTIWTILGKGWRYVVLLGAWQWLVGF